MAGAFPVSRSSIAPSLLEVHCLVGCKRAEPFGSLHISLRSGLGRRSRPTITGTGRRLRAERYLIHFELLSDWPPSQSRMHAKENIPAGVPMFGKKNIPTPVTQALDSNIQTRKSCRARYVSSSCVFSSSSVILVMFFQVRGTRDNQDISPVLSRFPTSSSLLMRARYARASRLVCQGEKGLSIDFLRLRLRSLAWGHGLISGAGAMPRPKDQ